MHEIIGDLWEIGKKGEWIAIPTNGIVTANGKLVMGRGLAYQFKIGNSGVDRLLGDMVQQHGNVPILLPQERVVTFPTKYHFKDPSNLELIYESADHIFQMWEHPHAMHAQREDILYLPRVGCGNGGLLWGQVRPVLLSVFDHDPRFVIVTHPDDVSDTGPDHRT